MDDISIDFIKEIGEYDDIFARILQSKGAEHIYGEIIAYLRDLKEKNPERAHEWQRMYSDIIRLKEKISEQREEIRMHVASYSVSNDEYNEIMANANQEQQRTRLKRVLEERMNEIESTLLGSGNFDKQVHSLGEPNEMLHMRKLIHIDQKDIAEALSIALIEDAASKQIFLSLLDEKKEASHTVASNQKDQPMEIICEEALKETTRMLSRIEQYQQGGLQGIRRLAEFDRQIVYMLVTLALKKHK